MLERKVDIFTRKLTHTEYYEKINEFNIETMPSFQLFLIFRNEDPKVRNVYLHNVISNWFEIQNPNEFSTFRRLKKILRKTKVELSDVEEYQIDLLEERLFSSIRHIKQLDVNYPLLPKEVVSVKFEGCEIFEKYKFHNELLTKGFLYFTQDRLLLESKGQPFDNFNIYWENTKDIIFDDENGLTIETFENRKFVIKIHDSKSLNNTFKNLIDKKIKPLVKFL